MDLEAFEVRRPTHTLYIYDRLDAISPAQLEQAMDALPPWRKAQALRFKHEQGRKECTFAYLLLCHALHQIYGIETQPSFSIGEHGKPHIANDTKGIEFNISHCHGAIACVVADHPIGVDIEHIGRYRETIAQRVLNPDELREVSQSPCPQETFTRYWTQKEAIVKWLGLSIMNNDLPRLLQIHNHATLHTEVYPAKGYAVTVAE